MNDELEKKLDAKFDKLTTAVVETVNGLREDMATKDELAESRAEMNAGFDQVRAEMNGRFNGVQNQLDDILDERLQVRVRLDKLEVAVFGVGANAGMGAGKS